MLRCDFLFDLGGETRVCGSVGNSKCLFEAFGEPNTILSLSSSIIFSLAFFNLFSIFSYLFFRSIYFERKSLNFPLSPLKASSNFLASS
jgi:hypothetical protein